MKKINPVISKGTLFFVVIIILGTLSPALSFERLENVLSLEECVHMAFERNDLLNSARGRVKSAAARKDLAESGYNPKISVNGTYGVYTEEHRLAQATYDGERGSYDEQLLRSDLVLSIPLYTGGRVRNEVDAARNLHKREENLYSRSEEELEFEVSRIYFTTIGQEKINSFLLASRKTMESHYSRMENLLKAGRAASVELTRIGVELSSIEQKLLKAEGELKLRYLDLAHLMGIQYSEEPFILKDTLEVKKPGSDLEKLIVTALEQRPDLEAASHSVKAGEHAIKAAEALNDPQVSLQSSLIYLQNTEGENDTSGFVGVNIEFPLWDGGISRARIKEAEGERDTAFFQKEDLISRISLEVESAYTDLVTTYKRVEVAEKAMENAREGLRIEMLKHEMNKGTVTDVLQAQSSLLAAEADYTVALVEHNIAGSGLRLAMGDETI